MQLASEHIILCPVWQWDALVKRIRKYPGSTDDTPVLAVWKNHKIEHVTSAEMVAALMDAVCAIGEDKLGFKEKKVGTHSQRSGAAMSMYLGECPVYTIMIFGRWYSDAFLIYTRKKVEQFSHNVSRRMIRFQFHLHIPDLEPAVSHLDLRQRTHPDNSDTRRNSGGNL